MALMEEDIDKYLFNLLSDEEKQLVLKELDGDNVLQQEFADKLNTLSLVMAQEKEGDKAYAQRKYKGFKQKVRNVFIRRIMLQAVRYAAVILLAAGIFSLYQYYGSKRSEPAYVCFEAPVGQRALLSLPDGTTVWLNAGSKLKYPSDFSAKNRHISLDGEGYFDVFSDEKHPFTVQTALSEIKVLGTKFNVKSYKGETSFITLLKGKVEITTSDKQNKLILKPNEQACISEANGHITLSRQIKTEGVKAWIFGAFVYVNQPLSGIVKDLERQFDVRISIPDRPLSEELFTTKSTPDETLIQFLDRLKETRELDYEMDGNSIQIFKR
ncbi:MAG: FecR domain-containing protein [Tannerellaceae bacterium]|jgi:ferric-dicitrate binding protein FerR (iron transport regulator)|nr:FecR domain-containing protein [Tannerellaceae bacterium]